MSGGNEELEALKKKTLEIVQKNLKDVSYGFSVLKSSKNGFITKYGFNKTLVQLDIGFTSSDVETIMENFVEYEEDLINYDEFLEVFGGIRAESMS